MAYLYRGTGYLANAVTIASTKKSYLINDTGYITDDIRIGDNDFGIRVFNDGGTIESYKCASEKIIFLKRIT